ncbi:hypothetical protein V1514DRAFT_283499, partial [Lipomyces japonicus]|uniref:uncharacterized protein n=1 Tax=Lipomyces japonicus TaxID=56871 RepID=UPI0034CEB74B
FENDMPIVVNPDKNEYWFVQTKNCQSMNIGIRRCRACTRRKSGVGACRFIGIRVFREDVSGADYEGKNPVYGLSDNVAVATLFRQSETNPDHGGGNSVSTVRSGRIWKADYLKNICFAIPHRSRHDVDYVLDRIAPVFGEFLKKELIIEDKIENLLRIVPKESEAYRSLCDICGTFLFSGRYMCYHCGLEMCVDCYTDWQNMGHDDKNNGKLVRNTLRFMFEFCVYGNRHLQDKFLPVSRMMPTDIKQLYMTVQDRISGRQLVTSLETASDTVPLHKLPNHDDESVLGISKPIHYDDGVLTVDDFRRIWLQGDPIVIRNVGSKLKLPWTPKYFADTYGRDRCMLINGGSDSAAFEANIEKFCEGFDSGTFNGVRANLRLKDWPTTLDFKEACPDLFEDFEQALPFELYTRREGFCNLASMFPKEYNPPDLGPKLYNAYASSHAAHGKGSTCLHMDVTDAVNIMAYAVPNGTPDGLKNIPGLNMSEPQPVIGAVWDIFRAEDSDTVRRFITEREQENRDAYPSPFYVAKRDKTTTGAGASNGSTTVGKFSTDDPIHRQIFYLTDPELILLRKRTGVMPFRIWQKPGDAVFIPAGCAHQVCNISSCIKAAIDFVSPENLHRCVKLMAETRQMSRVKKKEDVLQLKQILHYAWTKTLMIEDSFSST